jgi:hypothetical protein
VDHNELLERLDGLQTVADRLRGLLGQKRLPLLPLAKTAVAVDQATGKLAKLADELGKSSNGRAK